MLCFTAKLLPASSVAVHTTELTPIGNSAGHAVVVEPLGRVVMRVTVGEMSQLSAGFKSGSAITAPTSEPASVGTLTTSGRTVRVGFTPSRTIAGRLTSAIIGGELRSRTPTLLAEGSMALKRTISATWQAAAPALTRKCTTATSALFPV